LLAVQLSVSCPHSYLLLARPGSMKAVATTLALLAGCSYAGGVRIVKQRNQSGPTATLLEVGGLKSDKRSIMKGLADVDPPKINDVMITGIGKFNFHGGDVHKEMKQFIKTTAVGIGQTVASKIHPMLGIVYAIFSSLFNWGGASDQSVYRANLLKTVDKMIKGRIGEYSAKMKREKVSSLMTQMDVWATRADQWVNFPTQVGGALSQIFGENCWEKWKGRDCLAERTSGSRGGAGLVLELHFMDLVTTSFCTFRGYGHKNFHLTELILQAALRTSEHMAAFKTYRETFSSSSHGVTTDGGKVDCNGNSLRSGCWTDPSKDHLLGTEICGQPKKDRGGTWTQQKADLIAQRDTCISNYKEEIIEELKTLEAMTAAQLKAAHHIRDTGGERTFLRKRSAICERSDDWDRDKYERNFGANKLGACAEWVEHEDACSVWFNFNSGRGWCDCVPSRMVPCKIQALNRKPRYDYNVYALTQSSKASAIVLDQLPLQRNARMNNKNNSSPSRRHL